MNGLSVVIPSRTITNLRACASAVHAYEPDARIIVIDDGLPWGWLHPNQEVIVSVLGIKPFIFSRAVNQGIARAGRDDVVILGDDGLLQGSLESEGGFSLLQRAAEEHPEYGVIGCVTNNVGNRNQFPQNVGLREDPRMICFVAVLIPRRTIDLVGLLDERFNSYSHQDDDYCLRVRRAGLKIGIHDGCFVDHKTLPSTFRSVGGPGGELATGAEIFRQKWGADNHAL